MWYGSEIGRISANRGSVVGSYSVSGSEDAMAVLVATEVVAVYQLKLWCY